MVGRSGTTAEAIPSGGYRGRAMATAEHGQQRTALVSVVAAVALVVVKLVAGLASGSLGLIAEALHSGTDLVAALLTLFAVRLAVRPADREHHYGHGKAEHLAALAESAVLALVSGFIALESLRRLFADGGGTPEAPWWSLAVIATVIVIDAGRAVASARAARRYQSAALASNALHFAGRQDVVVWPLAPLA